MQPKGEIRRPALVDVDDGQDQFVVLVMKHTFLDQADDLKN